VGSCERVKGVGTTCLDVNCVRLCGAIWQDAKARLGPVQLGEPSFVAGDCHCMFCFRRKEIGQGIEAIGPQQMKRRVAWRDLGARCHSLDLSAMRRSFGRA
jgi:hypothetical protein